MLIKFMESVGCFSSPCDFSTVPSTPTVLHDSFFSIFYTQLKTVSYSLWPDCWSAVTRCDFTLQRGYNINVRVESMRKWQVFLFPWTVVKSKFKFTKNICNAEVDRTLHINLISNKMY